MSPPQSPLAQRRNVFLLALLCCLLWGSSYPAIKNGYELFGIEGGDIPSKLVFAGWRFALAGLALLAWVAASGRELCGWPARAWGQLAVLGLLQTTLQYIFFYIGVANTTGVKASIMNATGTFFSVLLAHWLYHNDRISHAKAWGCILGFAGVMAVNFGAGLTGALTAFEFALLGEGFVVIAALVLALGGIYGKSISQGMDPVVMTAYQLTIGGVVLLVLGYAMGGGLGEVTWASSSLLAYLVMLSAVAISIWSLLLKHNRVSLVTAFNFMVPVFGTLLSAWFLEENLLEWRNAAALVLVCGGIWLVTKVAAPRA
ncbi:DMT family transporter [Paracidovorax valerianellae]|uniref:Permease of the drug/metabolite transporter (DMT) superfamily n=1 Tax=Paracidovorax valerianellae TaxID=187868 RepID=A0A1G6XV94_9BURK|nr:EamA family transporter [Paracidovorax valerianellae]MDA8443551.1 EamA family transporter [Paracidovorax valerianellae]SDD81347.1 Permease of the drug/metabolite transporter (DMT) superfamily [Paracidovorax valerianellae]